jgi:[ribosomal protein S5]-alanine N-acetyltransferase
VGSPYDRRVTTDIRLIRLSHAPLRDLLAVVNDPLVIRHMPLAGEPFDEDAGREWVAAKERLWDEHGYGPWAVLAEGDVAGWAGLQPTDEGEPEIALVLAPSRWGIGKAVLDLLLHDAFEVRKLPYVLVFFPPSRARVRGLLRLGFHQEGEQTIEGERFLRFRLDRDDAVSRGTVC